MTASWKLMGAEWKRRREDAGMSVPEAALKTGLSDLTIRNMEAGRQPGGDKTHSKLLALYGGESAVDGSAPAPVAAGSLQHFQIVIDVNVRGVRA
jgi:hypothetical protein